MTDLQMSEDYVDLTASESSTIFQLMPSINTITFYRGAPPIEFLRNKVKQIVEKNPWLEGRLVRRGAIVSIKYPIRPVYNSLFLSHTLDLSPRARYEEICSIVSPFAIKPSRHCVDKNEPLFRVVVMIISGNEFAIFMSVSHSLGDGHTFYNIHGMLGETVPARSYISKRIDQFEEKIEAFMDGDNTVTKWFTSVGAILNLLATAAASPRAQGHIFTIDLNRISTLKSEHAQSPQSSNIPFVSTNDILTSWFFRAAKCCVGIMAVNCRNRIAGCTDDHAGNLDTAMLYQPADYTTPALIRLSLRRFRRAVSGAPPGLLPSAVGHVAMMSNWTTFYQEAAFDSAGCEQLLHLPCIPCSDILWTAALLFRPTRERLGLLLLSRHMRPQHLLQQEPRVLLQEGSTGSIL